MAWAGLLPLNDEGTTTVVAGGGGSGARLLAMNQRDKYVHALFGRPEFVKTIENKVNRESDETERKQLREAVQNIKRSLSEAEEDRKYVEGIAAKEIVAKDASIASMKAQLADLEQRIKELGDKLAIAEENEEILIALL